MTEVEKKKRGRKPKNEKEPKPCVKELEKVDPQILHLNITRNISSDTKSDSGLVNTDIYESDFCNYNPCMNEPNAYNENDHFTSKPCELMITKNDKPQNSNVKVLLQNIDKHQICYQTYNLQLLYVICNYYICNMIHVICNYYRCNVIYVIRNR